MKTIGKEYTNKAERIAFLKDNCDNMVEKSYSKAFKPEELQQYKEELVQVCDRIDAIEEEKKSVVKEYKLQLDPLQSKRKAMIGNIRSKAKLVTEDCFQFIDRDARMTEFYNDEGDCIEERPATADELQIGLFTNLRPVVKGKEMDATGTEGK